ncbi:hypothetical protein B0H66DRAFT_565930 [Apodospora peruviana]|uniref:Uncharacterized protein n=1 Tax=Apodospora peruviana TaxID=516989 RepID=A0AAE0LZF6_9PEZI|nr:hypothetical protein B0H66DRAFT_565930 [Apodospora peruviana]
MLAEEARRDGSSMKTIAILTMLFLPATFFSTLFSMPSLGWDQPDKIALYWACTVPVTVATFALWTSITQREAIRILARNLRDSLREKRKKTVVDRPGPGRWLSRRKSRRRVRDPTATS